MRRLFGTRRGQLLFRKISASSSINTLPAIGPYAGLPETNINTLSDLSVDAGLVPDDTTTRTNPLQYKILTVQGSGQIITDPGSGFTDSIFIRAHKVELQSGCSIRANGVNGADAFFDGCGTFYCGNGAGGGSGGAGGSGSNACEGPALGGLGGNDGADGGNGNSTNCNMVPGTGGTGYAQTTSLGFSYGNGSGGLSGTDPNGGGGGSGGNGCGGGGGGGGSDGGAAGAGGGGGSGAGKTVIEGNWLAVTGFITVQAAGGSGGAGFAPGGNGGSGGNGVHWWAFRKKTGGTTLAPFGNTSRIYAISRDGLTLTLKNWTDVWNNLD